VGQVRILYVILENIKEYSAVTENLPGNINSAVH